MRREDAERLLHHHYRLHTQVKSQIDNKPPKSMFVSPKSVHYKTFTNRVTRPKSLDNLVKGQTKRSGQDELVQFVNRPQVASVTNSLPSQSGSFNVYVRRSLTNVAQFLPSTASTSAASLRPTTLKRSLFDSSRIRAKILDDRNYAPPLRRSGPPSTIALDKSFRRLAIQSSNVSQKSTTSHEKVPNTSGKLRMVQCMMRARTASTNTARRKLLSASENVSDQAKNVMAVTLGKEYQDFKDTVLSNIIRRGVFNDRVIKNSFYKEIERRRDLDLNQMEIIMFDTLAELNVKIVETLPPPPPSRALRPLTAKPRKVTIANPKRLIESDEGDSDLSIANDDEKGEDSSSKSSTTSSSKTESNSDSKSDGDTPRAMSPNIRSINSSSSQLDDDSKSDNNSDNASMKSPLPPPPDELLCNNETIGSITDAHGDSNDAAMQVINDAFKFTGMEEALSTVSCFESRLRDRSTIVKTEQRTENDVTAISSIGTLEVSAASTPKSSKRWRSSIKPAKHAYYSSSDSSGNDSDISAEWMMLEKTKSKWHTPTRSRKFDLYSNECVTPRGPPTRYTTSLAAITTPTSCTRVFSQKKHPFSPQSFKFYNTKWRSLPTHINELSAPSVCLSYKPDAASTPQGSIAPQRPALHSFNSFLSFETTMEHVAEGSFRAGLMRLATKINSEEAHIREAKASILYWRRKDCKSKLLHHELSAQALLLISRIRLEVYRELVTRIHTFYRMSVGPHPVTTSVLSCFKVNTITINLCKNYYTRSNLDDNGKYYAFVIVLSSHEKVIATDLQHTIKASGMHAKRIRIDEEIVFNNLPLTFQIKLEVYTVKILTKAGCTPKELAKRVFQFIGQCHSPPVTNSLNVLNDDNDDAYEFKPAGHAHLDRSMVGHKSFLLLQNEYPLEGSIDVSASCSSLPPALREITTGFWRLLSDESIVRYWVRMVNGVINFYETPEGDCNRTASSIPTFTTNAENEPLFMIDISTICNRTIERETAIFSALSDRRFCFYIDVVSFPRGADVCEHKRFLVGVDSEAELIKWVRALNHIIDIIRDPAV